MKSFESLKKNIIEQPVLALPYFSKVFQVDCDASGSTIGIKPRRKTDSIFHQEIEMLRRNTLFMIKSFMLLYKP
jgi:hypothetical protein